MQGPEPLGRSEARHYAFHYHNDGCCKSKQHLRSQGRRWTGRLTFERHADGIVRAAPAARRRKTPAILCFPKRYFAVRSCCAWPDALPHACIKLVLKPCQVTCHVKPAAAEAIRSEGPNCCRDASQGLQISYWTPLH